MLIMVTGGVSSGKTRFALSYASRLARDGIYVTANDFAESPDKMKAPARLRTIHMSSEHSLPDLLDHINRESNLFAAERRIVIIDSLTAWLEGEMRECWNTQDRMRLRDKVDYMKEVVSSYQGIILIVTNEMHGSFHPSEEEKLFVSWMAEMNRLIASRSDQVFLLTSGIATEIRREQTRY
ncbi:bifunctional adenosylcobinamide kinase/adenosylcobinamide-phosphate guanylyltransferase [Neobacillus mesonae]|nr:bifunctional adenosylcobinamide kinase/adenosylcobinamide-phosphate guanylyltransferase [Neobacillus mesonae]